MLRQAIVVGMLAGLVVAWQPPGAVAIPVPYASWVGVNHVTNRVYVDIAEAVAVIDGARDKVVAIIPMGRCCLSGIGVNFTTNRIYVGAEKSVVVIDGARDTVVATIPMEAGTGRVGVNATTNRTYVASFLTDSVFVVDGAQNKIITSIPVGVGPSGVGVNPTTNRIYVPNSRSNSVSVIDGARDMVIATIPVGRLPLGAGVNPVTNRIYVANFRENDVSVIDGAKDVVIATVPVGVEPVDAGVNSTTNRITVSNHSSNSISVIDGVEDIVVATLPVGNMPFGVRINHVTNRIYVANGGSGTVSVLVGNDLLTNGSFDGANGNLPQSWRSRNLETKDGLASDRYDGKFSMKFKGAAGIRKQLVQRIAASGPAGTTLNLEAFSKADGMTPGQGEYRVQIKVVYADRTSGAFDLDFGRSGEGTFGWRRRTRSFTVPKDYQHLVARAAYENPTGTVWFDAVHLWPSE